MNFLAKNIQPDQHFNTLIFLWINLKLSSTVRIFLNKYFRNSSFKIKLISALTQKKCFVQLDTLENN